MSKRKVKTIYGYRNAEDFEVDGKIIAIVGLLGVIILLLST